MDITLEKGAKLSGKWKIESLIGRGACAKVYNVSYLGTNLDVEFPLVAKVI